MESILLALLPLVLLLLLLARPPSVPPLLLSLPGLGDMYLQLLRAAVRKGKAPKKLDGHPLVRVRLWWSWLCMSSQ
jgi:hypothetical protein